MSNLGHPRVGALRPGLTVLPFGRHRYTATQTLANGWKLADSQVLPWGTTVLAGEKITATNRTNTILANLCLIGGQEAVQSGPEWLWVRIYETLTATFTDEEAPVIDYELNGLKRITRKLIALPGSTNGYVQGTSTEAGCTLAQLKDVSDDRAARLILVFMEPGIVATQTTFSNNGALEQRSITTFGVVPSTPSGFVLVGSQESETEGVPTRTYQFAKGTGQISNDPSEDNNGALLRIAIRYLSAPGATNPIPAQATYYALPASYQEADGHRVWSQEFVKGEGEVSNVKRLQAGGVVVTQTLTLFAPAAAAPAEPTHLISRETSKRAGHKVVSDQFYESSSISAAKLISDSLPVGQRDGSFQRTYVYHGAAASFTAPAPAGYYLVSEPEDKEDGLLVRKTYTYIKPPADDTIPKQVSFNIPGLATAANPPVFESSTTITKMASVAITYSTSKTSSVPYSVTQWAYISENYKVTATGEQVSTIKALEGYLGSSSVVGTNTTYRGIDVDSFAVSVSGSTPSSKPTGATIVEVNCEPYLTATNGTIVYRNIIATITL